MKSKLRIYNKTGIDKGKLNHEEYFNSIDDAIKRYKELYIKEDYGYNPTLWIFHEHWHRVEGF